MKKGARKILTLLTVGILMFELFLSAAPMNAYAETGVWKQDDKGWWFEMGNDYLRSVVARIEGEVYAFGPDGYMLADQWKYLPDSDTYIYLGSDGAMITNAWVNNYYVGEDGGMLKDTLTPDGYYVDANGKWDGNSPSSSRTSGNQQLSSKQKTSSASTGEDSKSSTQKKTQDNSRSLPASRNTIKATIDGVDVTFYLAQSSYKNGKYKFEAFSLTEDQQIGRKMTIEVARGALSSSGTLFSELYSVGYTSLYGKYYWNDQLIKLSLTSSNIHSEGVDIQGTFSGWFSFENKTAVKVENGTFDLHSAETVPYVESIAQEAGKLQSSSGSSSQSYTPPVDLPTRKEEYKCPACHGNGKCSNCAGRGERRVKFSSEAFDCLVCHGTGVCQTCHGTGRN